MSTSTASSFKWQMPIRTFPGIVTQRLHFRDKWQKGALCPKPWHLKTLDNCFLVPKCFDGDVEVVDSCNVLKYFCSVF